MMRVKCVDNWFYEHLLKRNEIYVVIREASESYIIMVDRVGYVSVSKDKFVIEEDKTEEIRVVRKLEDLDGLENGHGAKIYLTIQGELRVSVGGIKWFDPNVGGVDIDDVLKMLGFKFEYKPARTEQEVLEEIDNIKSLKYDNENSNWCIVFNEDSGFYSYAVDYRLSRLGTKYMPEEQAKKYVNELNEIIGVGK